MLNKLQNFDLSFGEESRRNPKVLTVLAVLKTMKSELAWSWRSPAQFYFGLISGPRIGSCHATGSHARRGLVYVLAFFSSQTSTDSTRVYYIVSKTDSKHRFVFEL